MTEENEKTKKEVRRGGAHPGSGRLGTDSKLNAFRAPGETAKVTDGQRSEPDFIRACIEKTIGGAETAFGKIGTIYPAASLAGLDLPFFDLSIKAGFPIPLDNDEKSQEVNLLRMICPHPNASYLIRVEGDSMIDADIHSGDIVIVDKSNRNPSPSEVAVCELNGEYTLKRFELRGGGEGWLVPANPDFPEIRVSADDDFSIWGVVTYIIHKAR